MLFICVVSVGRPAGIGSTFLAGFNSLWGRESMRIPSSLRAIAFALTGFTGANAAHAAFHVMQIEQVIGGVINGTNVDTTAQAIQLRLRSSGQNQIQFASLWVADAAGANRVLLLNIASPVSNGATGDRVLIASPHFANYFNPPLAPDFTMANLIPASYLNAGRLTYEADGGSVSSPGTIYWSLSWGGSGYTGSQTGDLSNDANGNFGPAFGSPLPSTNRNALLFTGTASALSTQNSADYAFSANPATFTKNSGQAFTIFQPLIVAISREFNNIRVSWTTVAGKTNSLQRSASTSDGSLSTNFTDIFILTNSLGSVTNYLDIGAVTNFRAGYYRVRLVP